MLAIGDPLLATSHRLLDNSQVIADLADGEEFAGHRIERLLGRGGMGVVYLAEHLRLGRRVAIKILSPDLIGDEIVLRRFLRESRSAAALDHPNIVPVYDAGDVDGRAYISMRFVNGPDMDRWLRSIGDVSPAVAIRMVEQVASALDAAHAVGLIHRDVKPGNILLEGSPTGPGPTKAFLSDFGITTSIAGEATTDSGAFVGTVDYTAPEQIARKAIDGRTDQYSLACVLFRCLTGAAPYAGGSQIAVMYAHLHSDPPTPSTVRPDLLGSFDAVIRRALAKSKESRYRTCSEFVGEAAHALGVPFRTLRLNTERASAAVTLDTGTVSEADTDRTETLPRARRVRPLGRKGIAALTAVVVMVAATVSAIVVRQLGHQDGAVAAGPRFVWHRLPDRDLVFGGPGSQVINRAETWPGGMVVVGSNSAAGTPTAAQWVSDDGSAWAPGAVQTSPDATRSGFADVAWNGRDFVAAGIAALPTEGKEVAVWSSVNGSSWDGPVTFGGPGDQQVYTATPLGSQTLIAGWTSTDGEDRDAAAWLGHGSAWAPQVSVDFAGPGNQEIWGSTTFRGHLLAVGSDSRNGDSDAAVWIRDGTTWQQVAADTLHSAGNQVMKSVVRTGSGLVAVGASAVAGASDGAAWASSDALHWTRVDATGLRAPGFQSMSSVCVVGGGLISVGAEGERGAYDGGVWTSPDGEHWTPRPDRALGGSANQWIKDVVLFKGNVFAVGIDTGANLGAAAIWVGTPADGG